MLRRQSNADRQSPSAACHLAPPEAKIAPRRRTHKRGAQLQRRSHLNAITERADNPRDTQTFKMLCTKLQTRSARSYMYETQNVAQSHIDDLDTPARTYR
jgi:hypothetical protein